MIAAFVYKDYYCNGIKDSFRGVYQDIDDALSLLNGDRYDYSNLETMNLETLEIKIYEWIPLYEYEEKYSLKEGEKEITFSHRWDKTAEDIIFTYNIDRIKDLYNHPLYRAGEWRIT